MIFDFSNQLPFKDRKRKNRFLYLLTYLALLMVFVFPGKSDFPFSTLHLWHNELPLTFLVLWVCILASYSLCFQFSENVFISLSFLKDIFTGYKIGSG